MNTLFRQDAGKRGFALVVALSNKFFLDEILQLDYGLTRSKKPLKAQRSLYSQRGVGANPSPET